MKAIIEFELPKEEIDYQIFISGNKFVSALKELKDFIDQSHDDFEMSREEIHYYKTMLNAFDEIITANGIKNLI